MSYSKNKDQQTGRSQLIYRRSPIIANEQLLHSSYAIVAIKNAAADRLSHYGTPSAFLPVTESSVAKGHIALAQFSLGSSACARPLNATGDGAKHTRAGQTRQNHAYLHII